MLLNSGRRPHTLVIEFLSQYISAPAEFYGRNPPTSNLELLSRFFEKYPEYAEKAFLSVKGATKADSLMTDNSSV